MDDIYELFSKLKTFADVNGLNKEQAKNMTRDELEEYWIQNQYADYLKSKDQEND